VAKERKPADASKAADSLRKIAALTSNLPDDSPADPQLRDRLELASDVLDATVDAEE
jgi:cytochrome c556